MAGIDYSSLPMGANPETDQIVGYTEFGEPIRRARFGGAEYSIEQVATGKQGSAVKEAIKHPLDTVGAVASGVAGAIWNGLQTPGRAARGETITNGDLTDTLGLAAVGPVGGTAPQGALRSGLSRTETSQQILDMLKGGKAADITDDMMSAADAQYLYQNYDLPMDAASRMQRAEGMGFDTGTDLYRGDRDLQSYGRGAPGAREGIGVSVSDSPEVASTYVPEDGGLSSLFGRSSKPVEIDGQGNSWRMIEPDTSVTTPTNGKTRPLDEILDPEQYLSDEALQDYQAGLPYARYTTDELSRAMQGKGADRVTFDGIKDFGGSGRYMTDRAKDPSRVSMFSDPSQLRSRFARFDPRLKHLSNLSAGVAGAGVFGSTEDNKAQIRAWLEGNQ